MFRIPGRQRQDWDLTYIIGVGQEAGAGDKDGPVTKPTLINLLIGQLALRLPILEDQSVKVVITTSAMGGCLRERKGCEPDARTE